VVVFSSQRGPRDVREHQEGFGDFINTKIQKYNKVVHIKLGGWNKRECSAKIASVILTNATNAINNKTIRAQIASVLSEPIVDLSEPFVV
jgi:hypothetical protein